MSTPSQFLTSGTKMAASLLPEPEINSPYTAGADFEGEATQSFDFAIPNLPKTPNTGLIGSGPDPTDATPGYWTQPTVRVQNRLNGGQFAKRLKRHMAGPVVDAPVVGAAGAFDHFLELRAYDDDPQIEGTSFIVKYGGLDLLLSSMISNGMDITHQNGADPTFNNALVGTGKHQFVGDISPAFGAIPRFNALQKYMNGAAVYLTQNNGELVNLSSLGRYRQWNFSASNQLKTNDQRGGDPLVADVGMVAEVVVTAGGAGYTSTPNVVFTGGGGGAGAVAEAIVKAGVVTGIRMKNRGSGYTASPVISFTGGGGGAGATAVALLGPDVKFGAYVRNLLRGTPTISAQSHIHVAGHRDEFMDHWNGVELLGVNWLTRGARIGQTNAFHEVELIVPRSQINTIAPEDQADDALLILDYLPLLDDINETARWRARIRNGSATLI